MIVLPPEVGESLGLGPLFQMTPFEYKTFRLNCQTTDGPEALDVIVFHDTGGRRGYAFRSDSFRTFATTMVEASSGLVIPTHNQRNGQHE